MISVVMPAYNCERFVAEAIESILHQTYHDFELLIVDDGSTDQTGFIASCFAERDTRVRVIHSPHGGPSRARNTGINLASCPWVALMDADDVSLPERFEKQMNEARRNPSVAVWGTYAYHINSTGRRLGLSANGPITEQEFHEMRNRGHVPFLIHATALMKRESLIAVGQYDPSFEVVEDLELFERLATQGPIVALPEPHYLRRIHASNLTTSKFFLARTLTRYVRARQKARIAGTPLPTLREFLDLRHQERILTRAQRTADDLGQYCYRKAALHYADANYMRSLFYVGAGSCLSPSYTLRRIYDQRISKHARQWLAD